MEVREGLPGGAAGDAIEETVTLGGREVRLLRPRSGDAVLDEVLNEDNPGDERLPYWAELWPSGVALAAAVLAAPLTGIRVLELGCGLGLVSVAAALAGARVLAADQSPEAVAFTAANARNNGVAVRTVRCGFDSAEPLLAEEPFPLVVASDVIYEPLNVPMLVALLPRLVPPGGHVWLADPGRPPEQRFVSEVDRAGWRRTSTRATGKVTIHRLVRTPVPGHAGDSWIDQV
jgi:predicted nicotinamide N-methyase